MVPRVYGAETSAAGQRSPAARTLRTRARLCLCPKPGVFHTRPFLPAQTPAPHLCAPAGAIPGDAGVPPATFVPGKSSHSGARWASAEVPESVQKRPCARSVMLTDRAQYYPTRTWGEETFCLNEKCPWLIANCVLWRYCFSLSLTGKRRQRAQATTADEAGPPETPQTAGLSVTPSLCGSKQLQAQQQLSKKQHDKKQPVILPSDFEKEGALLQMRMEGGRDSAGRLLPWVGGKGRPLPPTPPPRPTPGASISVHTSSGRWRPAELC